jgi:hypothetical protein
MKRGRRGIRREEEEGEKKEEEKKKKKDTCIGKSISFL